MLLKSPSLPLGHDLTMQRHKNYIKNFHYKHSKLFQHIAILEKEKKKEKRNRLIVFHNNYFEEASWQLAPTKGRPYNKLSQ